ncbi:hypothetical protein FRX31_007000, partial [Thalictrum thalictroides]
MKRGLVHEHYANGEWKLECRRRNLGTGETLEMNDLMAMLNSTNINEESDVWEWSGNKNKCFTDKSFYSTLLKDHKDYVPQAEPFPHKLVWEAKIPLG